jgi:hypothetical protein
MVWNAAEAAGYVVVADVDLLVGIGSAKTPNPGENFGEGSREVEIWFGGWVDPVVDSITVIGRTMRGVEEGTGVFVGVIYIGYAEGRHMGVVAEQDKAAVEEGNKTGSRIFDRSLACFIDILQ